MNLPLSSLQGMIGYLLGRCPAGSLSGFDYPCQDSMDHADFSLSLSIACETAVSTAKQSLRQWAATGQMPPWPEIPAFVLHVSLQTARDTYGAAEPSGNVALPEPLWSKVQINEVLALVFDEASEMALEPYIDWFSTEAEDHWKKTHGEQ